MRIKLWFPGNPIPKGRPIVTFSGTYTPEITRLWEEEVGWQCRSQFDHRPLEGPLGIEFIFFRENRRKVDIDNLEKSMLDALQGILFKDDAQVKDKHSVLLYNEEHPGVEVEIWTL